MFRQARSTAGHHTWWALTSRICLSILAGSCLTLHTAQRRVNLGSPAMPPLLPTFTFNSQKWENWKIKVLCAILIENSFLNSYCDISIYYYHFALFISCNVLQFLAALAECIFSSCSCLVIVTGNFKKIADQM